MVTYKMIKGEKAMKEFICRLKGKEARVNWSGTFGHCDEITVELIYLESPKYEGYMAWYLLTMRHPSGRFVCHEDCRDEAKRLVREGKQ